jgi:hypothetical protein
MHRSSAVLLALVPALALAGERTLLLKTFEDARYPADLALCEAQGYPKLNVVLGASVWSLQTNAARGEVTNDEIRLLGSATGCGMMTSAVPYTPRQPFLIRFQLEDGTYTAKGECDIVSVTVPAQGLMLAGCALRLVEAPEGVVGGFATSSSVFNPYGVAGFGTGSVWTLHLYTADAPLAKE